MKDIPRGAYLDCFARQSEGHREHEDVAFGAISRPAADWMTGFTPANEQVCG